ncbi:MAG: cytochrome c oxidase assembly factor Coa1 family protein [Treponemataceae bacterium]
MFKFFLFATVAVVFVSMFKFIFSIIWNTEPAKYSLELVKNHALAQAHLGEKYRKGLFITGNVQMHGGDGWASLRYKLKGKTGFAKVEVLAEQKNHKWIYQNISFHRNGDEYDIIDLLENKDAVYKTEKVFNELAAKSKLRSDHKLMLMITGGIFALILPIIVLVCFGYLDSEPYKYSRELIKNNAEVQEYLGRDFKKSGFTKWSYSTDSGSGEAEFKYKLKGEKGVADVHVIADMVNGVWIYRKIVVYKDGGGRGIIDLTPR